MTALALAHHPVPEMSQLFSLVKNKPPKEMNCVQFAWGQSVQMWGQTCAQSQGMGNLASQALPAF